MRKISAFLMSKAELEEILQEELDDVGLKLFPKDEFFEARSDQNFLDGGLIDERLSEFFGVREGIHYRHVKPSREDVIFTVIEE